MPEHSHPVQAHFVLKKGASAQSGDVSIGSLQIADPQTRQAAKDALQKLGLKVKRSSPLSITVVGDSKQFAQLFQADIDSQGPDPTDAKWRSRPRMPANLQPFVEDVVFPEKAELH